MSPSKITAFNLTKLIRVSRPRFWIYVFGPYIVGLAAGANQLTDFYHWPILLFGLFFTFPANLLIYGVNDIFDYETDKNNIKKADYEALVIPSEHLTLWRTIIIVLLPFVPALITLNRWCWLALIAFFFFSIFYSAPPIRAKAKPLLDSAFNVLYIFPGVFAYFLIGGHSLSLQLVLAAWCWAMAMHAYSAVPDIIADKESSVPTVATFLGLHGTLILCALLYGSAALLSFSTLKLLSLALGAIYVCLMLVSLDAGTEDGVRRIYKFFPLTNTLSGAALFWSVALSKFV